MDDSELTLRQEAIRARLKGESPHNIYTRVGRTRSWFYKWWGRFVQGRSQALESQSRAPYLSHRIAPQTKQAILHLRQQFEEQAHKEDGFASIGAEAIYWEMRALHFDPVPSICTIGRILKRHGLIRPPEAPEEPSPEAFYPHPPVEGPNSVHQLDIASRRLEGGTWMHSFHSVDIASRRVCLRAFENKDVKAAKAFLLRLWKQVGLSRFLVLDNEATFSGGCLHPRAIGQIVRLCLYVGVEPVFTPFYAPKKKALIESINSLFECRLWRKHRIRTSDQLTSLLASFQQYLNKEHRWGKLSGRTALEMFPEFVPRRLTQPFQPPGRLPLVTGRIHFVRKVFPQGELSLLNEVWMVPETLAGEYLWATIDVEAQKLRLEHQEGPQTPREKIKELDYPLQGEIQPSPHLPLHSPETDT